MKNVLFPAIVLAFLLSGCTTTHLRLENLSLGMTKQEVISVLGRPDNVASSFIDQNPPYQEKEIWEYYQYETQDGFFYRNQLFLVAFSSGHLVKWGRPGQFSRPPDEIKEIQIR